MKPPSFSAQCKIIQAKAKTIAVPAIRVAKVSMLFARPAKKGRQHLWLLWVVSSLTRS